MCFQVFDLTKCRAGPLCSTPISVIPGEDLNDKVDLHIERECSVMTGRAEKKTSVPTCKGSRCDKKLWVSFTCEVSLNNDNQRLHEVYYAL